MCYAFNGVVIRRCYVSFVYVARERVVGARGESQRVSLRECLHTAKRSSDTQTLNLCASIKNME